MRSFVDSVNVLYASILLNEGPVSADFEPFQSSLQGGIGSASGGGYLIGSIADQLKISKEAVIGLIAKTLYTNV